MEAILSIILLSSSFCINVYFRKKFIPANPFLPPSAPHASQKFLYRENYPVMLLYQLKGLKELSFGYYHPQAYPTPHRQQNPSNRYYLNLVGCAKIYHETYISSRERNASTKIWIIVSHLQIQTFLILLISIIIPKIVYYKNKTTESNP